MKWWPEQCVPGDMIRVRVGAVWHYGIFVSDDEVIEFGPPPLRLSEGKPDFRVMAADIDDFSAGGIVERAVLDREEQKRRLPPEKTVAIARSRVGEGGYDLLHNNCEHFAHACVFGVERSAQEDELRQKWLNRPILDVYLAKIPAGLVPEPVWPPERSDWIDAPSDAQTRRERYAVWKLLERGISRSFGLQMRDLTFTRQRGKWSCDRLQFSLSHSGGVAAAAVSNGPVGLDVETDAAFAARRPDERQLARDLRRICTPAERRALQDGADPRVLWTKKECLYKRFGEGGFFSKRIDTAARPSVSCAVTRPEAATVSVCGDRLEHVRFFLADAGSIRPLTADEVRRLDRRNGL